MTKDKAISVLDTIIDDLIKRKSQLSTSNLSPDLIAAYLYSEYNINMYDLCKKS